MRKANMATASIRTAAREDVPLVLALWARARSLAASLPDDDDSLALLLERDPSSLLVAELEGRLVGALVAGWDGWRGNMYRLAVEPPHRLAGIGSQLVAEGERRLRERGARRISAIVGRGEDAASALWESAGYGRDAGVERYVKNL